MLRLDLALGLPRPPPPAGAAIPWGCHTEVSLPSHPMPEENQQPQAPGMGPSPAEPHVPLFMRGKLEQAPQAGSGR